MNKQGIIGVLCAAVLAVAIAVPFGLGGGVAPVEPSPEQPTAATSVSEADGFETPAGDDEACEPAGGGAGAGGEGSAYQQGVVLVGLRDGVTAADLNVRLTDLDYIATKRVADDDVTFGYVKLALADGVAVKDAEARIAAENADIVAGAQPNYYYSALDDGLTAATLEPLSSINDPRASEQWGLDAVNAYEAWDLVKTEGAVTVAVLDNGFFIDHEDLADNIVTTYNSVDKSTDVNPEYGDHGTHVCGIVAAEANNSKGVAGVSYNAGLLPIKTFHICQDDQGTFVGTTSIDLAAAYDFVLDHASEYSIKVVNMSLGGAQTQLFEEEGDFLLFNAVKGATREGILTVAAAGNEGSSGAYQNFPSDWLEDSLSVIALANTSPFSRASYSNYNLAGQRVKNISAPGSGVLSTGGTSSSRYVSKNGTSMATPFVSGIAALLFTLDPSLTPTETIDILCRTAQDLNADENIDGAFDLQTGYGLVDAQAAVQQVPNSRLMHDADVSLSFEECTYSGQAQTPGVTVKMGEAELEEGVDYALAYSGNVDAGTARVTVRGLGDLMGSVTREFTIKPKAVTPTVELSAESLVYNGSVQKPGVTVKLDGVVLAPSDYEVAWASGRKNVGSYSATVTLKGNYSGSQSATFSITPRAAAVKADDKQKTYDNDPSTDPELTATVAGVIADDRISYSLNRDLGQGAGSYAIVVTFGENPNYEVTTENGTFTIERRSVTVKADDKQKTYDNDPSSDPELTATVAGVIAGDELDCSLSREEGQDVGTYAIAVTLGENPNYEVVAEPGAFTITPKAIEPIVELSQSSFVYDGRSHLPIETVKDGDKVLQPGVDYDLLFPKTCVDVRSYWVSVELKGNYSGEATAEFKIVPKGTRISKVKRLKRGFTVKWKKQAVQTSGYQLQYSRKKNFSSKKTLTVKKVKVTSKTVRKLKAKKRYYVRVRTFTVVNGVKYYSAWSAKKSVKTL